MHGTCARCGEDLDECLSLPCENGGHVNKFINNIISISIVIMSQHPSTIHHAITTTAGTCQNLPAQPATFACSCVPGFDGTRCENAIDECR